MPKEQFRNVDLARIGFGHAIAVTQLQMASVYSKITTGNNITPYIAKRITTNNNVLYENVSAESKLKLKTETIETINKMLLNNINNEYKLI